MPTPNTKTKEIPVTSGAKENTAMTISENENQTSSATSLDMGPVEAYAKLEGQYFCYYIRTLQVTLGRKVNRPDKTDNVDIPLGNTKLVSRQHARLFYNFTTQRFEMMVIGKNGAFVNGQFIERGITIPLENRTKITIGEINFVFLLPYMDTGDGNSTGRNDATPQHSEKQRKRKVHQQDNTNSSSSFNSAITNINNQVDYAEEEQVDEELKKTLIGYPGVPNPYLGKEDKPPFSYANLIAQALNNASTDKRMTLNEIYTYLSTAYPYFKKVSSTGWQNSVRHNLSLNKAFIKMPRSNNDSGKGAFWTIDPTLEYSIFATNVPIKQRNNKRSSGLSSPASSSKEGDDDSTGTNVITTGSPNKKQRKDKMTKNADDNSKGKTEQLAKDATFSSTSDTLESASSFVATKNSTASSSSPPPSSPLSQSSILTSTVEIETPAAQGAAREGKNTKTKQQKPSKSKATVSSSGSLSTNDIPNTLTAPSLPSSAPSSTSVITGTMQTPSDALGSGSEFGSAMTTSASPTSTAANLQVQLQLQLQNTIRQHLLDPIRYPLPPTIAQLLPQAIAQLPPQIANQLSSTLNVALRAQQQHQLQQQRLQENQPQQPQQQQQQNNSASEGSGGHLTQTAIPSSTAESNITTMTTNTPTDAAPIIESNH